MQVLTWLVVLLLWYILCMGVAETAAQSCPMGADPRASQNDQLSALFPGRFLSHGQSMTIERHTPTLHKFIRIRKLNSQNTRVDTGNNCCKRSDSIVKPISVKDGKKTYYVVHLPNQAQLFVISECEQLNKRCGYDKTCRHYTLVNWVLIWDSDVTHIPSIRFVTVRMPAGCECI